jgi:hypothetical protein
MCFLEVGVSAVTRGYFIEPTHFQSFLFINVVRSHPSCPQVILPSESRRGWAICSPFVDGCGALTVCSGCVKTCVGGIPVGENTSGKRWCRVVMLYSGVISLLELNAKEGTTVCSVCEGPGKGCALLALGCTMLLLPKFDLVRSGFRVEWRLPCGSEDIQDSVEKEYGPWSGSKPVVCRKCSQFSGNCGSMTESTTFPSVILQGH